MMESKTVLDELEEKIWEFSETLKNYHRYTDKEIYKYIGDIERYVDILIRQHKPSKATDFRYKAFRDLLGDYENVMKALREAVESKDYTRARALLRELITAVRSLERNLAFLSSAVESLPSAETTRELERYIGEGQVAENLHEFDSRVKSLSYTAREILTHVFNSPLREIHIRDLPVKMGLTGKGVGKIIGDAIDELTRKMPDVVEVVPDSRRGGVKIRIKRW